LAVCVENVELRVVRGERRSGILGALVADYVGHLAGFSDHQLLEHLPQLVAVSREIVQNF